MNWKIRLFPKEKHTWCCNEGFVPSSKLVGNQRRVSWLQCKEPHHCFTAHPQDARYDLIEFFPHLLKMFYLTYCFDLAGEIN